MNQLTHLALGLALCAAFSSSPGAHPAAPNPTPYDDCGILIQGTDCVLYQSNDGNLYYLTDGYGTFQLGDNLHIVGEASNCFSGCTFTGGCIFNVTMIESCDYDPTTSFCLGDGSATSCPCGNVGDIGAGCGNSTGLGARLLGSGGADVASDTLALHASQLPPNKPALLFSGTSEIPGSILGDGLRCVSGGISRHGVQLSDSQGAATWGSGLISQAGWQAGDTVRTQVWYRDSGSAVCGSGFNVSNGALVVLTP
ncbi:MAG: hypothetical protein ACI9F9_002976 [Candidatus Paceibacteria bacterium]|jgi:hypothetical protein